MPSHSLDILGRLTVPVPAAVIARAEAWTPGAPPAEPVRSASVVLLRDGGTGLEVYLLHRHARMAFAASMAAFPGGGMAPADAGSGDDPWRACAVRETEEETGVRLEPAMLWEWAHWTTPEFELLRYDTRFYVAALPGGAVARDISGETDLARWWRPGDTLAAVAADEIRLMPPTLSVLAELAEANSVADVLDAAHHRTVERVLPRLVNAGGRWGFEYPSRGGATRGEPDVTGPTARYLRHVRAPNPGPMTLTGTNTWLLGDPAAGPPVVVDPGPDEPEHLERVLALCGGAIAAVLLTHGHADHAQAAPVLAARAGCSVLAADRRLCSGPKGLDDGDRLRVPGAGLSVYATPGHTSDSISVLLAGDDGVTRLLTGDTVLGSGTTVIMHPDGNLAAYLASLDRLQLLVASEGVRELLPGHGPTVAAPDRWLAHYAVHRRERLQQVRAAVAAGDRTAAEVVSRVYAEVDRAVWPAAELSVEAQLAYLRELGEVPGS
jgi:glyoxylase-like metal-dependent hydrolase (beta-lactamase superfamily II)/8-oxo-dGTP pyrophosphatase MutT (NUDIX family)